MVARIKTLLLAMSLIFAQLIPVTGFASDTSDPGAVQANRDEDPEQYFRDIGRDDLADKYASQENQRTAGIVFMVIKDLFLPLAALAYLGESFDNENPDYSSSIMLAVVGSAIFIGGVTLFVINGEPSKEELNSWEEQPVSWSTPQLGLRIQF